MRVDIARFWAKFVDAKPTYHTKRLAPESGRYLPSYFVNYSSNLIPIAFMSMATRRRYPHPGTPLTPAHRGLVVDVVPRDHVVRPSRQPPPHRERHPRPPRLLEQLQHLSPLIAVGQVRHPVVR